MKVSFYCATCLERLDAPPPADVPSGEVACPSGHGPVAFRHSPEVTKGTAVDRCSRCEGTAFFVQRDFDQRLGCALLALGALVALGVAKLFGGVWFVPALLTIAAVDFLLARRIPQVVICYRCDTEYRGAPDVSAHRPYDPHIAERYAEVKTVRRMNA